MIEYDFAKKVEREALAVARMREELVRIIAENLDPDWVEAEDHEIVQYCRWYWNEKSKQGPDMMFAEDGSWRAVEEALNEEAYLEGWKD